MPASRDDGRRPCRRREMMDDDYAGVARDYPTGLRKVALASSSAVSFTFGHSGPVAPRPWPRCPAHVLRWPSFLPPAPGAEMLNTCPGLSFCVSLRPGPSFFPFHVRHQAKSRFVRESLSLMSLFDPTHDNKRYCHDFDSRGSRKTGGGSHLARAGKRSQAECRGSRAEGRDRSCRGHGWRPRSCRGQGWRPRSCRGQGWCPRGCRGQSGVCEAAEDRVVSAELPRTGWCLRGCRWQGGVCEAADDRGGVREAADDRGDVRPGCPLASHDNK